MERLLAGYPFAMPSIIVQRETKGFGDRFRSYRVVLDGETVGRVKRGESFSVEADAGAHQLHFAVDWARSPSVDLALAEQEQAVVRCWPNVRPLLALYFMTLGRGRWIGVDVSSGTTRTPAAPLSN
jgi:hypothetical protein